MIALTSARAAVTRAWSGRSITRGTISAARIPRMVMTTRIRLRVKHSALGTLVGTVHSVDAAATTAFADFAVAYDALAAMPCDAANNLTGQALAGKTLAPGVYCFPSTTANLTAGTLTLDAGGDANAV